MSAPQDLARHIARAVEALAGGKPVPDGLFAACERCAHEVLVYRVRDENSVLRRKDLRARIEKVREAANTILEEVNGPLGKAQFQGNPKFVTLYNYLLAEDEVRLEFDNDLFTILSSLKLRCDAFLVNLHTGPGRGRAVPRVVEANRESGTVMCALLVVDLWKQVHEQIPSEKNSDAQLACAELWAAAGGDRPYWGGKEARTGWRPDLSAALKIVAASTSGAPPAK